MPVKIQNLGLILAVGTTALIPNTLFDKFPFFIFFSGLLFTFVALHYRKLLKPNFRLILILLGLFNLSLAVSGFYTQRSFSRIMVGEWHRNLGLLHYASLSVVLIFFLVTFNQKVVKNLSLSLAWLGIFFCFVGIIEYFRKINGTNADSLNGISLTLGNPNFAAVALVFTATATIVLIVAQKIGSSKFYFYSVSFFFQLFLIFETKSLQGVVLFTISLALIILLRFFYSPKNKLFISPSSVMLLVSLNVFAAVFIVGNYGIEKFISQVSSSLLDRYYHWIAAVRMMKENYLFGVGVDSYGDSYRLFRIPEALLLRGESNTFANNAHNIYLQLGSTSGLFALATYLLLNIYVLWRGLHALDKNRGNFSIQGIFVLWTVFQVQSLISIDQLGLASWGWIFGGLLVAISFANTDENVPIPGITSTSPTRKSTEKFQTNKFIFIYSVYLLISSFILIPGMRQEFKVFESISKLNSAESQLALNLEISNLYEIASHAQQPSLRVKAILELFKFQRTDLALKLASASTADFPENVAIWDCVASIYEAQGKFAEAIPARRITVKLDPLNDNLADLLERNLSYSK